jgi:hypothetical protein
VSLRRVIHVHDQLGRIVLDINREQAERMVRLGQARWVAHKQALRLAAHYEIAETGGSTHTSRSAYLGAIGRSQCYTIDDTRGRVTGFKHIDRVDRHIFQAATLDCMATT